MSTQTSKLLEVLDRLAALIPREILRSQPLGPLSPAAAAAQSTVAGEGTTQRPPRAKAICPATGALSPLTTKPSGSVPSDQILPVAVFDYQFHTRMWAGHQVLFARLFNSHGTIQFTRNASVKRGLKMRMHRAAGLNVTLGADCAVVRAGCSRDANTSRNGARSG
jgi:hypothetical protein